MAKENFELNIPEYALRELTYASVPFRTADKKLCFLTKRLQESLPDKSGNIKPGIVPVHTGEVMDAYRRIVLAYSRLSIAMDRIMTCCFPPEFDNVATSEELCDPQHYGIFTTAKMLLLKVPMSCKAFYREPPKNGKNTAETPVRYPQVRALLHTADNLPNLTGKKTLYLYHSVSDYMSRRKTPDLDNFDVKYLIDSIMNLYGGDNSWNMDLILGAGLNPSLPVGTYAALVDQSSDHDPETLLKELENAFGEGKNS